jgi:hypothetical protein
MSVHQVICMKQNYMHLVESKCLTVKSEHDAQAMYGMAPIGTLEDFLIHGLPAALQSGKLTSV